MTTTEPRAPLVVFCLDAGDPHLIEEFAGNGSLPTIASIMKRGWWGRTGGPELLFEHGSWVSILSGVSHADHGHYWLRQLKAGTYELQTSHGPGATAEPFWACLRGTRQRVAIIDVPDHSPITEGLDGIQFSNFATHAPTTSAIFHPPELRERVRLHFGRQMRISEDIASSRARDRRIFRRLAARVRKKGELCRQLLAGEHFDLIAIGFAETHTGGHQFWKYQGAPRPGFDQELGGAIRELYQLIDGEIGRILSSLPNQSHVFVVSSVGLVDQYPAQGLIEDFCFRLGYQMKRAGEVNLVDPINLLRQTIPTPIRDRLSTLLPQSTRERFVSDKFSGGTDWSRTRLFALPSFYSSFLRVNLRGREPQGIVDLASGYESLLDEVEADLLALIEPVTGESPVAQVSRVGELLRQHPPQELPDLIVKWQPAKHLMKRLVHPRAELVQSRPVFNRATDHSANGFVAAAGPLIASEGRCEEVDPLTLAPRMLRLLGIEEASQSNRTLAGGAAGG